MNDVAYDAKFFELHAEGSLRSARAVVPIVLELTGASSVIDFGCGTGTWLKAFRENGVDEIRGLDGPYIDKARLQIDPSCFRESDLASPVGPDRTFDLAICLEVAEHLPTRSSLSLVKALAAAAPFVLFSSALPGQGGTDHKNEQWPEFWERLFSGAAMTKQDVIRPRISRNHDVEWWYRQNLYLYASDPAWQAPSSSMPATDLEAISPDILDAYKSFGSLFRATARAAVRGLKNRAARRRWGRTS